MQQRVSTNPGQSHQDSQEAPCPTTWPGSSEACNQEGSVISEANSSRRRKGREGEERGGEEKREEKETQKGEKTFSRSPCESKRESDLIMKSPQDGAGKRI